MNRFFTNILNPLLFLSFLTVNALAERPIRGTYEVPTDENLKSFARYPIKFKADIYQKTPTEIKFPMPLMLVGEEKIFTMSQLENQGDQWEGPNVKGNCQTIERYFKCSVRFNDLAIDPVKVANSIQNSGLPPKEIDGKLQVARHFESEPIGILIYRMRGDGPK